MGWLGGRISPVGTRTFGCVVYLSEGRPGPVHTPTHLPPPTLLKDTGLGSIE